MAVGVVVILGVSITRVVGIVLTWAIWKGARHVSACFRWCAGSVIVDYSDIDGFIGVYNDTDVDLAGEWIRGIVVNDGDGGGGRRCRRWVGRHTIVIVTPGVVVVVVGVVIGGVLPTRVLSASARVVVAPVVIATRVSASRV